MKKILLIFVIFSSTISLSNAENYRIISGNQNAKITIIAYESLTCSHCANFHKDIYTKLQRDYIDNGLAKIEFRHFPLDIAALNASKITQCNKEQSLEILNILYKNQKNWIKGNTLDEISINLKKFVENEKFDIDFEKCINNKDIEDFVLNDRIEGVKKFDINATPTIIINNKKFDKTLNYKNLKETLEKLI